jgi:nucleotide-binding universal stress UspA family protein
VITAHAESLLQEATLAAVRADAGQVELRVVQGVPGRSLVEAARTVGADLLVLATRADGVMSWLLGSQDMLCNAPCPVLLEPEHINRAVSGAVSGAAELCLGTEEK